MEETNTYQKLKKFLSSSSLVCAEMLETWIEFDCDIMIVLCMKKKNS